MAANALEMLWIGLELGLSKGHSMLTRREFALGDPERQARAANSIGEGILIQRVFVCQGFSA